MTTRASHDYPRLVEQQTYFSAKAERAKAAHFRSKMTVVVLAALIPILALVQGPFWATLAAFAGALIAIIEGAQSLYAWQETWVSCRSVAERLTSEAVRYENRIGAYDLDDGAAKKLLAQRVEDVLATEHQEWKTRQDEAGAKEPHQT